MTEKQEDTIARAVMKDVVTIGRDTVDCAVHTIALFVVLSVLAVDYSVAISTSVLLGAVKIFSSETETNYGAHTKEHLTRRLNGATHPSSGDNPCGG